MAKILIDGRFYGLEHAGLGRYTMGLVDNLNRLDKTNNYQIFLRKKYFNTLKLASNWKKIECNIAHYSLDEQLRLPLALSRINYDVFHALNPNIPLLFLFLNKLVLKKKIIITVHDTTQLKTDLQATTLPLPYYYLKNFGYKILFREAVVSSDAIITPTRHVKDEIVSGYGLGRKKVKAIYEGVSEEGFEEMTNELAKNHKIKKPYFIYVGNAYPHKNVEKAIDAVSLLNKSRKAQADFVIVSARNDFVKKLGKYTKGRGFASFVKYLGYVPDAEMNVLLANSVAFVYPSLSEGFGLPGLEAMRAGTLVLASDISVFKEVYKNHATYFDPLEVKSIADAMKKSLSISLSERKKSTENAKKFAKRYSWNKMAKETLQVYNEALR